MVATLIDRQLNLKPITALEINTIRNRMKKSQQKKNNLNFFYQQVKEWPTLHALIPVQMQCFKR